MTQHLEQRLCRTPLPPRMLSVGLVNSDKALRVKSLEMGQLRGGNLLLCAGLLRNFSNAVGDLNGMNALTAAASWFHKRRC